MKFSNPLYSSKPILNAILQDLESLEEGQYFLQQSSIVMALGLIRKMDDGNGIPKGLLTVLAITCENFLRHNNELFNGMYSDAEIINSFYEEYLKYFYEEYLDDKRKALYRFIRFLDICCNDSVNFTGELYVMMCKACVKFEDKYFDELLRIGDSFVELPPLCSSIF